MAPRIASTLLSFVKTHPLALCSLLLLFMPPVYRLLLFFTPLLGSTALCVLALVSWGQNPGVQQIKNDKSNRMEEWVLLRLSEQHTKESEKRCEKLEDAASGDSERICHEGCGEAPEEGDYLLGSTEKQVRLAETCEGERHLDDEHSSFRRETGEPIVATSELTSVDADMLEPDPDLTPEKACEDAHVVEEVYASQPALSKELEQRETVSSSGITSPLEGMQDKHAKLVRAVERELAVLDASLLAWNTMNANKRDAMTNDSSMPTQNTSREQADDGDQQTWIHLTTSIPLAQTG